MKMGATQQEPRGDESDEEADARLGIASISEEGERKKEEVSEFARYYAAQAWCTPKTEKIVMDVILAEAFARILDELLSEPWLGNATTGELLEELKARIYLDGRLEYRTSERRGEVMKVSE